MARGPAATGAGPATGRGREGQTAGHRTGHGNLSIGRTGARRRRWDQCWGASEEKIEGPSATLFCPMVRRCKRVDVDVGLCHQKERQACLFGSGTRKGWPVARGSVCQMQVVSNHRSGVAARNTPSGKEAGRVPGQVPGTAWASRLFVQSLSGGARSPNQLTPVDSDPHGFGRRLLLLLLSMCLCTCVPRFHSRSAEETQVNIILYLLIRESSRGGYLGSSTGRRLLQPS